MNVKSFQENMAKCALCKNRKGIKGFQVYPADVEPVNACE